MLQSTSADGKSSISGAGILKIKYQNLTIMKYFKLGPVRKRFSNGIKIIVLVWVMVGIVLVHPLAVEEFFAFNYLNFIELDLLATSTLVINQTAFARMVRGGLFIPAYLRDKEAIIRQNLNTIEQKFDEVIANGLTSLRLDDRHIGLEALARETEILIRGANPMMILEEILQVNLSNSEYPGRLNNQEWQEVADEISFFFDITDESTIRETKYLDEIKRELISVATGESEMTNGHSNKPYLHTGMASCIAVILYDKNTQLGILMHFKRDQINIESELENSLQELERKGININDLDVRMIGGSIWTANHREEIKFIIRVYKAIKDQKNITLAEKDILGYRRDRIIALNTRNGVIYAVLTDRESP